jgi:hypothetical protein
MTDSVGRSVVVSGEMTPRFADVPVVPERSGERYRSPLIAVDHGGLLQLGREADHRRLVRLVDRAGGVRAHDAHVAVPDFMLRCVRRYPLGSRLLRNHNGVELGRYATACARGHRSDTPVIGCAARLKSALTGRSSAGLAHQASGSPSRNH